MSDLLGRAERIVAMATARGADQAEVYMEAGAGLDVELENDRITGAGTQRSGGGAVRLSQDGRSGFAYFTRDDDAEKAIDQALATARLATKRALELPGPQSLRAMGGRWDESLRALDVDHALGLARDVLSAAKDTAPNAIVSGGIGVSWSEEAIANSHGLAATDRSTALQAYASLVLADGETSISCWETGSSHDASLDCAALARSAAQTALDLRGPKPAETGSADLILRPDAAAELVTGLLSQAVHGDSAKRGKSFWSDQLGETVAPQHFSLIDDPWAAGAIGVAPFDGDGAAVTRTPILEAGVLQTFLFDARDAGMHGVASTGHGGRDGFKSPPSTGPHHLVLEGTTTSTDQLIADIDHGYLVESMLGAHTANGTTGDFSVTSPNVWRIKDGAVAGACKEIAIGGNIRELLMGLDALGDDVKRMDGAQVPSLRVRGMHVSA